MNDPLQVLAILVMFAVAIVLVLGIGGFGKGGEVNRKYGNKLMRLRIILQAAAVALILLLIYLRGQGG